MALRSGSTWAVVIASLAASSSVVPGAERRPFRTAEQLRAAAEPLFRRSTVPRLPRQPEDRDDSKRLFVVRYLSSEDPEMREAAVDILARLARLGNRGRIRASAFDPYLTLEHPLAVRVVALAYSFSGFVAEGEAEPEPKARIVERRRAAWSLLLNDLIQQPVVPPNLDVLLIAMDRSPFMGLVELIRPQNIGRMLTRSFQSLSSARSGFDRKRMVFAIALFPQDAVAEACLEWYATEPEREARAAFIAEIRVFGKGDREGMLKFHPVLRLAAEDWDPEIAAKARRVLQQ